MDSAVRQQRREHAESLHRAGRLTDADRHYGELLGEDPSDHELWHLAGIVRMQVGDLRGAVARLRRAASLEPARPDYHCNLGIALKAMNEAAEAERCLRRALALEPALAVALNALAGLLHGHGRVSDAARLFRQAVEADPALAAAWCNLSGISAEQGDARLALEAARRATSLAPRVGEAHAALARATLLAGLPAEAEPAWRNALRLSPGVADYHYGLGDSLEALGRLEDALAEYEIALQLDPAHGPALGALLMGHRQVCRWERLDELSRRFREGVLAGQEGLSPFLTLVDSDDPELQLACARRWCETLRLRAAGGPAAPPAARRVGPIAIGYLSADWYRHPTAYLTAGLLEAHDRACFRVLVFSTGPDDGSDTRRRIMAAADEFVDLRALSPAEAAERIRATGVELLVDVKGHTQNSCAAILACRPAPVQVNYLAYCATSGAPFVDYIIADPHVLPSGDEPLYSEAVVRLPETFWCEDARRALPADPPPRQDCGLPREGFVYCCFNNAWKLGPVVLDVWARILQATPGSVLWLQDTAPGTRLRDNLRREAARRGVDGERLVFCPRLPLEDYLARYRLADLFLDTWPYNAHTRAADAIWAGLPVLTWPGRSFAARVAASQLRAAGMHELVAYDAADYERRAVEFGTDASLSRAVRARVSAQASASRLFDTQRHARQLEAAYIMMARRSRRGMLPAPFDVAADAG